ncbi:MAG: hypothetical protein HY906_13215, partial [Deltaproteobacteria bacterium]|nr:hypothetical protein [Deltaproteobacteria bacterium]
MSELPGRQEAAPPSAGAAPQPGAAPGRPRPRWVLPMGLLVATIGTTTLAGLIQFGSWRGALAYSLPLMTILIAHEMGHFVAAKIHGVPASLPYFVPLPLPPGTLGAIISMVRRDEPVCQAPKGRGTGSCCTSPAGASPVPVSVGAPGSRPQVLGG